MSHDLYVYAPTPGVEKTALSLEMLNRGWRISFISPASDIDTENRHLLPPVGPLEFQATVLGWKTSDPLANKNEEVVAAGDLAALKLTGDAGSTFAAFLLTISPFDFDEAYGEDWQPKDESESSAANLAALKSAQWELFFQTSSYNSDLSVELQTSCWYAVAKLMNSYATDPQTDEEFIGTPPEPEVTGMLGWIYRIIRPYTK